MIAAVFVLSLFAAVAASALGMPGVGGFILGCAASAVASGFLPKKGRAS